MTSRGVAVMAVDWYELDPKGTPWSKVPEPELVQQVMRYNRAPMTILLDPKSAQINLTEYRAEGSFVGAIVVDSKRVIRWAGSAHDVAIIKRELDRLVPAK